MEPRCVEEKKSNLQSLTNDVRQYTISKYLEPIDLFGLSCTSKFFNKDTKNLVYWKEKILRFFDHTFDEHRLNFRGTFNQVIKYNVISNYKNLFLNIIQFAPDADIIKEPWQLLCLSGEINAIQYAIERKGMTASSLKGKWTPLHYVAASGSLEAFKFIINHPKFTKLNINAVTKKFKWNVLHFAVHRNNIEIVKFILFHPFFKKLRFCAKNDDYATAIHFAAKYASVETLELLVHDQRFNKVDPNSFVDMEGNILHLAIGARSLKKVHFILTNPFFKDLDRFDTSYSGLNALHFAVKIAHVDIVRYLLQNTPLNPTIKDEAGHDAFWHVERLRKNFSYKHSYVYQQILNLLKKYDSRQLISDIKSNQIVERPTKKLKIV